MHKIAAGILLIVVGANASRTHAAEDETPPANESAAATETTAQPATPAIGATLAPAGDCAGCCQTACHPQGCCLKKLLIWATYCPKERVGCGYNHCCNSCRYKGVLPFYVFYLNPKCVEGTGLHATFPNACYRGCKDCAAGAACGHP